MTEKGLVAGEDYFKDSYDTFGFEDTSWSPNNVKTLLRSLIEGKILQEMENAALLSFLYRNKMLNLSNRHKDFFRNLIPASKTKGGFEAIKDYAYSESEDPPSLEHYKQVLNTNTEEDEIKTINDDEIAEERFDPLHNPKLESIEDVIRQTESIDSLIDQMNKVTSISVDKEAMDFYLSYAINKYWRKVFEDEEATVEFLKKQKLSGNQFRDTVLQTFLEQYDHSKNLKIPPISRKNIMLSPMQRYVALMVLQRKYFGNFSGTGAGKTLAAIISSRVINSKNTLVICPNDVVDYWEDEIKTIYPDSVVTTKDDVFDSKYDSKQSQYMVLNWDKFNQKSLIPKLVQLGTQKIDFVILDEIHFTKNADSDRRDNLTGLLTAAKRKNLDLKLLGMTATPIVNKLQEGKSLLELITGIEFNELNTQPYVGNAVALYEKFTILSIRQLPSYEKARYEFAEVEAPLPDRETIARLKGTPLAIEQLLTEARIPEILKRIEGQTIIYSEYVGSVLPGKPTILNILSNAVTNAGFSCGFYTGDNRGGLELFKNGEIQVLIASRPIAVGVDGLQKVCNNLIFNTLPWTNAQYRQIIGRLVRQGQTKSKVHIHHIKASFPGVLYDEIKKLARINWKRALSDCAVDGYLPEGVLVTPEQATKEAVNWLERLERGEISVVSRRALEVELTPVEIKTRVRKYGEFSKLNQKLNTENSSTTHKRFTKDPEEFLEYHRQYAEQRKTWEVIPYEYWIKRLRSLSENNSIGDFGCGEAKIGQDPKLSGRVKSFDHVSVGDFTKVIPCDISNVSEYIKTGSLNVVVFSLSLMAKNWRDYLKEAHRCLSEYGLIFISETTNQVSERLSDLRDELEKLGFKIQKDDEKSLFTFIEAIKLGRD
ncbi:MAG: SNF2-related protein [Nitrosopumilus sp.]|nr:SNF2-related protein [Nitrosopumilus sp.]